MVSKSTLDIVHPDFRKIVEARTLAQVRTSLSDIQQATNAAVMATEQGSKSVEAGVKQSQEAMEATSVLSDSLRCGLEIGRPFHGLKELHIRCSYICKTRFQNG